MLPMNRPLRVCLVHAVGPLGQALQELGCEVLALSPEESGVFNMPAELNRHGFEPDILFQRERLGPRLLLAGLEDIPAVRIFWALDPHLNAFWHAPYARLFDLVFSTQKRWMPHLAACGAPRVRHLPWHAPDGPFVPFAERSRLAGFVGRLGPTRPVRTWLTELMRESLPQDFTLEDNLDFPAMLDFYSRTKAVPNESITGEVNFRLFEAAGCGCVVLAQELGPEQAELYEPGREMLVCADALELAENLKLLARSPRLAEALGRAAWERSQAEHLPLARARTILREAADAPRQGAGGQDARLWLTLALAGLYEGGRFSGGESSVAAQLAALPSAHPDFRGSDDSMFLTVNARLRLAHAQNRQNELAALLGAIDAHFAPCTSSTDTRLRTGHGLSLALACSMSLLGLGTSGRPAPDIAGALRFAARAGVALPEPSTSPVPLLLAWAQRLDEAGVPARGGFAFDVEQHLPACAAECLHCALHLHPGHEDALRAATGSLARFPGGEVLRLGLLSDLSLRARNDWRVSLELGLVSLQAFRPQPGLEELRLASHLAASLGESEAFAQALAQADASGRLRRALGG
jgi:hypothetical protein